MNEKNKALSHQVYSSSLFFFLALLCAPAMREQFLAEGLEEIMFETVKSTRDPLSEP